MGCGASKRKVQAAPVKDSISQEVQSQWKGPYFSQNPTVENWKFVEELGKGAMSVVYRVEHIETNEIAAAKVYNLQKLNKPALRAEERLINQVQTEINIMMNTDHRYLLSIIEAFECDDIGSLIIILPFASLGNVQGLLDKKQMTMSMIAICFHQIAVGLSHLHSNNVVHRDIKPENFLAFTDTYYVLSDFSVSTQLEKEDKLLEDTRGSPAFLSPEECSGEPFLGKPADVWAYGVSLYSALFGKLPFNLGENDSSCLANSVLMVTSTIQSKELVIPENEDIDPFAINLIEQCLQKNPLDRPTFQEIVNNPFFEEAWKIDEKNAAEDAELAQQDSFM